MSIKLKRLIRILPFAVVLVLVTIGWWRILNITYLARVRNGIAAILVLINLLMFLFSYRLAILFTGIILLLCTLNLASFTLEIRTESYSLSFGGFSVSTPEFQPWALLLLAVYLVINLRFLLNSFGKYGSAIK
ncbi:hypothetical protein COR50_21790 [Chitinophaga caeni]|uniref:Uncharacterized protein n=1 Tax=Chitinophaga caeni TaxID=2029983 RepID=A0A291R093_9BACT|nr:hypothetical protein [Chitinophaga caeni]ATL49595.1 hypothetical protein COR50_21790 [Chitinophaga caeni]